MRLEADWPHTLLGWDTREHEATDSEGRYNPRSCCAHPILVINFAREMGLDSLLPAAFYDLCRYGPSKIVAGASVSPPQGQTNGESISGSATAHISHADLRLVLQGRESAQRSVAIFIEEQLTSRSIADGCHNKDREAGRVCRESFYFIMLNVLRSVAGIACGRDSDPLYTLAQAAEMLSRNDFSDGTNMCSLKICAACSTDFTRAVDDARDYMWSQIPGWFGMQGFALEGR